MSTPFDFEPAYKAAGHGGVAWRVTRYVTEQQLVSLDLDDEFGEFEDEVENHERVVAHMIGDDRDFEFDITDLTPLTDEEYCGECGQVGCGWHN